MKLKLGLVFAVAVICSCFAHVRALPEIHAKLKNLAPGSRSNIMITIANRTDFILDRITTQVFETRKHRLNAVHDALVAHAKLTQAHVIAALAPFTRTGSITFSSYWITNQIFVRRASPTLIHALSVLPLIAKIEPEFFVPLVRSAAPVTAEVLVGQVKLSPATAHLSYGVIKIKAPEVWEEGFNGQNVLVATIDTGVRGTHEALKDRFLGKFGWYDPTAFTTSPNDKQGHGTHTMGTITGEGGIGVAPGATWAACVGCDTTQCSNDALTACGQYFVCPTSGSNFAMLLHSRFPSSILSTFFPLERDCSKAPNVISNSWGGSGHDEFYSPIVKAWHTAHIIPVFASGNAGPGCGTVGSPGDYEDVIGVGATDINDALASYSSVGPSSTGLIKPDIVAPGSNIVSSYFLADDSYTTLSGTSMATPHVAGVVALMLSKNMSLEYQQVYEILTHTTDKSVSNGKTCGTTSNSDVPNNSFGFGRVNALRAIQDVVAA